MRATIGYGLRLSNSSDYAALDDLCYKRNEKISLVLNGCGIGVLMIDESIQTFGPENPEYLNPAINQPNRRQQWIERMRSFCEAAKIKFTNEFDLDWYCCVY